MLLLTLAPVPPRLLAALESNRKNSNTTNAGGQEVSRRVSYLLVEFRVAQPKEPPPPAVVGRRRRWTERRPHCTATPAVNPKKTDEHPALPRRVNSPPPPLSFHSSVSLIRSFRPLPLSFRTPPITHWFSIASFELLFSAFHMLYSSFLVMYFTSRLALSFVLVYIPPQSYTPPSMPSFPIFLSVHDFSYPS